MCRRGFTLVEMLVVVAVIALLAALLFPVFTHARENFRQASCAGNLKQISAAVSLYAQDNDDFFPFGGEPGDLHTKSWVGTPWVQAVATLPLLSLPLSPYLKDDSVWDCPDDFGYSMAGNLENWPIDACQSGFQTYGMSYDYDTYLALLHKSLTSVAVWSRYPPYTEQGSDHVILMQDMNGFWHGGKKREHKHYNVLFCDGHVQFLNRTEDTNLWLQTFAPPSKISRK